MTLICFDRERKDVEFELTDGIVIKVESECGEESLFVQVEHIPHLLREARGKVYYVGEGEERLEIVGVR